MRKDSEMVSLRSVIETLCYMVDDDSDGVEEIMQLPTIDLVRCKECKFSEVWESTAGNELYCEKQRVCPYDWGTLTAFYVKADDYCSYGERREP